MIDTQAAFNKAQREYDNATPPEGPEPCQYHDWPDWGDDPVGVGFDGCPYCAAAEEDYRETVAEERRHGIY
jgi:hypothetical protein